MTQVVPAEEPQLGPSGSALQGAVQEPERQVGAVLLAEDERAAQVAVGLQRVDQRAAHRDLAGTAGLRVGRDPAGPGAPERDELLPEVEVRPLQGEELARARSRVSREQNQDALVVSR
ncbi:MAG TPA: hypothetical protein VGL81_13955 [Polyangiaceae bacterium]